LSGFILLRFSEGWNLADLEWLVGSSIGGFSKEWNGRGKWGLSPEISVHWFELLNRSWGGEVGTIAGSSVEWKLRDDVKLLWSLFMGAGVWSPIDVLRSVVRLSCERNASGGRSEVHGLLLNWTNIPCLVVILHGSSKVHWLVVIPGGVEVVLKDRSLRSQRMLDVVLLV